MTVFLKLFDLVPSWLYAGAVAALSAFCLWQGSQISSERLEWAEIRRDAAVASMRAVEVAQSETIRMQGERDAAVEEAEKRRDEDSRDGAAADRGLDGLRLELARTRSSLSSVSREACNARVTTLTELFESCTAEYRSLAEKAQGHLGDALTLDRAWPQ